MIHPWPIDGRGYSWIPSPLSSSDVEWLNLTSVDQLEQFEREMRTQCENWCFNEWPWLDVPVTVVFDLARMCLENNGYAMIRHTPSGRCVDHLGLKALRFGSRTVNYCAWLNRANGPSVDIERAGRLWRRYTATGVIRH